MKRRTATLGTLGVTAVLLLLLLLWAPAFFGASAVPAGQRPLLRLSTANRGDFGAAFDAGAAAPRLVLLLSPT
jgi:hypothetical protein